MRDFLDDSFISGNGFIYEPAWEVKPAAAHSGIVLAQSTITQHMIKILA
jgi:hypothetical protein